MLTPAQIDKYRRIRSEIEKLRRPGSHTYLPLDKVSELVEDGDNATFTVNGALVRMRPSGAILDKKGPDEGLPTCGSFASGLGVLPAVAADLLSAGSEHKRALHDRDHTPESFEAYLQYGEKIAAIASDSPRSRRKAGPNAQPSARRPSRSRPRVPDMKLQFPPDEIPSLVVLRESNVAQDDAFRAGRQIASGDYSIDNLKKIVRWKLEGLWPEHHISNLDRNPPDAVETALKVAADEKSSDEAAVGAIVGLHGVGVPVASAILTAINPKRFTIIDIRALRSLGIPDDVANDLKTDSRFYLVYLQQCRDLAKELNLELRTLDHALWQWGSKK